MAMNLTKLFEVQRKLDAEIEKKHPTLPEEDRTDKRIFAFLVELGELGNEWRGFKFWSTNQEPNRYKGEKNGVNGEFIESYPLLEEYVDNIHFVLSIGLDLGFDKNYIEIDLNIHKSYSILDQFMEVTNQLLDVYYTRDFRAYDQLLNSYLGLGEMLGFTWEQIEEAYMSKNKTNWERQANGY